MSKIIVSYRRSDSAATAGRIFDRLIDRYGEASVFMDIDRIPFGTDFRHHIQAVLRDANILLAVVGPSWLGKKPDGPSRIQDEADPVRVEIETALQQRLRVIPVLVDGATMPGAAELPESIRDFAYINAAPIDIGRDFRAHMERLTRSIDVILAPSPGSADQAAAVTAADTATKPKRRRIWTFAVVLVLLAVAGLALTPGLFDSTPPKKRSGDEIIIAAKPEPPPRVESGAVDVARPAPPLPVPPAPVTQNATATYRVLPNVSGGVQNLRSGPALKYPIVVAVPAGATGIAIGACFAAEDDTRPWCAATWQNHSGYISSCCIVNEKTGAPPKVE